jgi:hypothetical protein
MANRFLLFLCLYFSQSESWSANQGVSILASEHSGSPFFVPNNKFRPHGNTFPISREKKSRLLHMSDMMSKSKDARDSFHHSKDSISEKVKRVVIVGGGVGGVAVAARLAKERKDWDILLVEKNDHLGGRLDQIQIEGFRFDSGPTLLLAPEIYRSSFAAVGSEIQDWASLIRVEPAYTVFLSDNTRIILTSDMDVMREQLEKLEPGCFPRFLEYMKEARVNFEKGFASRPFQSPDNSIWVRPSPRLPLAETRSCVILRMRTDLERWFICRLKDPAYPTSPPLRTHPAPHKQIDG